MKTFLSFCYLLLININASISQTKSFVINPGESYSAKIPLTEMYEYPEFQKGVVVLKNNSSSLVKLNYNRLYQEIMFIEPSNGDTLALATPEMVEIIKINNDEFYFNSDCFVKVDTIINDIKIASQHYFTKSNESEAGYGKKIESSTVTGKTFVLQNAGDHIRQRMDLSPEETVILYTRSNLVLVDQNNKVYEINRKQLLKIFDKNDNKLKVYLSEKKPSFNSREDIIALIEYMTQQTN